MKLRVTVKPKEEPLELQNGNQGNALEKFSLLYYNYKYEQGSIILNIENYGLHHLRKSRKNYAIITEHSSILPNI